jgi:hypothetical protein
MQIRGFPVGAASSRDRLVAAGSRSYGAGRSIKAILGQAPRRLYGNTVSAVFRHSGNL